MMYGEYLSGRSSQKTSAPLCFFDFTDQAMEWPMHYGTKLGHFETKNPLSHEQGSERSERASERVSAAECASEASSPEQANE